MNQNHIIYFVFPFGVGLLCHKFLQIPDTSIWFYIWLGCIASLFIFVKLILPAQEQKFDAIKDIDIESSFRDKMKEQKPYSYIAGFHMLLFFVIIIVSFLN
ncbi:hypothetical protein FUA48_14270 [Flavobacterium alkalisoli]|uniref:Uncharacterized protein n=1 Tax=Flavobacterium alkalisoli TaxID=2602769 RepID=A0A5B9FUS7_9FLAO|nr:hypothetical protein [Flavobacterium alkalisoli]QEE50700.1 hypothetical protein FUA48_14270 [Flavobacterium alkalisoli]